MEKYFNTTGFCNPEKHYTINPLRGLEKQIYDLIKNEQYFLIHASRQTGKTTLLHSLTHQLNNEGKYIALVFSVEQAGYKSITENIANHKIITSLYTQSEVMLKEKYRPPKINANNSLSLYQYLNEWAKQQDKQIVLFIDEVDSLHDDVLISILRQLRDGFQSRPHNFPTSIALVGLRDIREYKEKARGDDSSLGAGSPFNIKAESFRLENFSKKEVFGLLEMHTAETGQAFTEEVKQKIYNYTDGQPWLTNALAREIVYSMYKNDFTKEISPEDVETAKERLIERRDTHLDSLMDKLRHPRIKPVIEAIISGSEVLYDNYNDDILYARDLGIVKKTDTGVVFANKIYKEIIPRVLNRMFQDNLDAKITPAWYIKSGKLDMDALLKAFQKFYRRHSESWLERFSFKEAGHQLLLMAFLQRVINGGGRIEREMAMGNGRTDLEIFYNDQHFVLELKINRDSYTKEEGIEQLSAYLDKAGLKHGYLVIFEPRNTKKKTWDERINWYTEKYPFGNSEKEITFVEM